MWVGLIQSVEGPSRTKDRPLLCKRKVFGHELQHQLFLVLYPAIPPADFGLGSLHNCVSQFLKGNLCTHTHGHGDTHTHTVLFLWGTLTHTGWEGRKSRNSGDSKWVFKSARRMAWLGLSGKGRRGQRWGLIETNHEKRQLESCWWPCEDLVCAQQMWAVFVFASCKSSRV